MSENLHIPVLKRIAEALERMSPPPPKEQILTKSDAYVWSPEENRLRAVPKVAGVELDLLVGIANTRDILLKNTHQFASGFPANNALLWGARGMGKSSLVKAVHTRVNGATKDRLILVEIHREDVITLPRLLARLSNQQGRFILFCDDLSFEHADSSYKPLKALLEGSVEERPKNIIFYATSNRRHLMSREIMENEAESAINPNEVVEEKVSLSDRFGIWLGFYTCTQNEYLEMIEKYANFYNLTGTQDELRAAALKWATTRGARSGRVAWQFIQDLAGQQHTTLGE